MLKENIFLVIAFSALAVLSALKLNEKFCSTKNPEDLESNQEKEKPDQPVIVETEAGLREEEQVESKVEPPVESDQNEAEISTETQLRKEELNGESNYEEGRPDFETTKKSQEDEIQAGLEMGLRNETEPTRQLEESQKIGQQEESINAAGQAGTSKDENGEDLQPNVSMRSTMSGLCSCLASLWFCAFLPVPVPVPSLFKETQYWSGSQDIWTY